MNILVLTDSTWDDCNSFGNTLTNWFGNWKDSSFSCMTMRSAIPNNKICSKYFVVSPIDVAKHLFTPWKIGCFYTVDSLPSRIESVENKVVGIRGFKRWLIIVALDILYCLPIWRNRNYKKFIETIHPDVVFLFATADSFVYKNVKYIKRHTNAKIAITSEDDVYGAMSDNKDWLSRIRKKRFKRMFRMADSLYGASQMMCDAYSDLFGRQFKPIYKGCEFAKVRTQVNHPIEMIYAGNLLYGRIETLSLLADALRKINKDEVVMRLTVYSGTRVSKEDIAAINDGRSSIFAGQKPYDEIKTLMHLSDITLHVESFEPDIQKLVRYSFSTKIIDCLQSGNTMMVIGPKNIASVEYSKSIPGAIVIDTTDKIHQVIEGIIKKPSSLISTSLMIREFAMKHHVIHQVRKQLENDFLHMKKKISFVVAIPGSAHVFLLEHMTELVKEFDVHLVANFLNEENRSAFEEIGVTCHQVPIGRQISLTNDLKALFALMKLFKNEQFVSVHSVTPKAGLLTSIAGWMTGVPHRIHIYTGQVWVTRKGLVRFILKVMDRLIALFVTNILADGKAQREFLIKERIIKKENSMVLANGSIAGVNLEKYSISDQVRTTERSMFGFKSNDVVFVFLGRLNHDKGVGELFEAFDKLVINYPNAKLLLYGLDEGYSNKANHYSNIKKGVNFFYPGSTRKPWEALQAGDVFVLPTWREGFVNSVIEAQALGLPAITSDAYGVVETCVPGHTGLRCRVNDPQGLYMCMKTYYEHPELRKTHGEAGRKRIEELFDNKIVTAAWVEYYRNLLK